MLCLLCSLSAELHWLQPCRHGHLLHVYACEHAAQNCEQWAELQPILWMAAFYWRVLVVYQIRVLSYVFASMIAVAIIRRYSMVSKSC